MAQQTFSGVPGDFSAGQVLTAADMDKLREFLLYLIKDGDETDTGEVSPLILDLNADRVGINTDAPYDKLHVVDAVTTVAGTQIWAEGRYGGYGAGISFASATSNGGTVKEMAKITGDGEAAWDTTAGNQDAGMRFFTCLDGTLAENMRLKADGELLIAKTSDAGAYKLQVNSQIWATSATIATSDESVKENVEDYTGGLDVISQLRPRTFTFADQADTIGASGEVLDQALNFPDGVQVGFVAQEVATALDGSPWLDALVKRDTRPEVTEVVDGETVVVREAADLWGLAEGTLIGPLVAAVQELSARVAALEG